MIGNNKLIRLGLGLGLGHGHVCRTDLKGCCSSASGGARDRMPGNTLNWSAADCTLPQLAGALTAIRSSATAKPNEVELVRDVLKAHIALQ